MQNYILIAAGAAFGGILRYWSTNTVQKLLPFIFPSGTLFVNFLGSFIPGFTPFYFDTRELLFHQNCGGLVTIEETRVIKYKAIKN